MNLKIYKLEELVLQQQQLKINNKTKRRMEWEEIPFYLEARTRCEFQ